MLKITFDEILTDRIGFGRAQWEQFLVISLIDFIDGFQEIMMGVLIAILTIEFKMNHFQEQMFSAIYFLGVVVGNFASSLLADRVGRRIIMIVSQLFTFVMIVLSSLAQNYTQMVVIRFFLGLLFGLSLPLSMVIVSEIVPLRIRGRFIVMLQLMFTLGLLYMIGCLQVFLKDYEHGNWRELLLFNSIPAFICFIGAAFILRESPRFLISQGKMEQAIQEINFMLTKNHPENTILINEEEIAGLQRGINERLKKSPQKQTNISELFNSNNLKVTLSILSVFLLFNLQGVGISSLLPFIFARAHIGFLPLLMAALVEIPAIFLVVLLIDNKQLGRKKFTFFGFSLMILADFILFFVGTQAIVPCIIIIRFGGRIVVSGIRTLPAESYATPYRSLGAGFVEGFGKLVGCASPFLMFKLYYSKEFLPFLVGGILCLAGAVSIMFHPKEMAQVSLDANEQDNDDSSRSEMEMKPTQQSQSGNVDGSQTIDLEDAEQKQKKRENSDL